LPDFSAETDQRIFAADDLSEQISTARKEATDTGNMKFTMIGALTIGTPDGASVEFRSAVGAESLFLFGQTVEQLAETWAGGYQLREIRECDPDFRGAIDLISSGLFSHGDAGLFRPLSDNPP
jgi:starch phosphorylase